MLKCSAANDFDARQCLRMNTWSAREYTMFEPTQLLSNWREQRHSNQGDLDSSVTGEVWRVHYTGLNLLLVSFLYSSTWLLLGGILIGTPCILLFVDMQQSTYEKSTRETYIKYQLKTVRWCSASYYRLLYKPKPGVCWAVGKPVSYSWGSGLYSWPGSWL
jgi:hypothetical protein